MLFKQVFDQLNGISQMYIPLLLVCSKNDKRDIRTNGFYRL